MFGFDGNVRKRSHINLGGARHVKDRQTLVQSIHERRLAREHERKRRESATKIQVSRKEQRSAFRFVVFLLSKAVHRIMSKHFVAFIVLSPILTL